MSQRRPAYISSRESYHHGDLRSALVIAARQLLEEGGASALSLRAAAQIAGVSAAAPYRHFRDREALYAAVLVDGFGELTALLETARTEAPDPVQAYLSVGRAYLGFAARQPALCSMMFSPEFDRVLHPELLEAGRAAFGVVLEAARTLQAAGLSGNRPAEAVALAGWTTVHGLASVQADGLLRHVLAMDAEDAGEALFSILIEGIAPR